LAGAGLDDFVAVVAAGLLNDRGGVGGGDILEDGRGIAGPGALLDAGELAAAALLDSGAVGAARLQDVELGRARAAREEELVASLTRRRSPAADGPTPAPWIAVARLAPPAPPCCAMRTMFGSAEVPVPAWRTIAVRSTPSCRTCATFQLAAFGLLPWTTSATRLRVAAPVGAVLPKKAAEKASVPVVPLPC
jgi:hypothetical protein